MKECLNSESEIESFMAKKKFIKHFRMYPIKKRTQIVSMLIRRLHLRRSRVAEDTWAFELKCRIDDLETGKSKTKNWEKVKANAISLLK